MPNSPQGWGLNKNKMSKLIQRQKIRYRVRKKIAGTASKPRLSVFRSNAEIYAQLIDDDNAATLASASSRDKDIAAQKVTKIEKSKMVGAAIARKAVELGITGCVFDRGGNLYHGRVKSVADGAREAGLQF
jgi:large subunit ribosomal protein L18